MLRHLYDIDGNILLSGEVEETLSEDRVACTLLREFQKTIRPHVRAPHFEKLWVRDAVFEDFAFDHLDLFNCVFENVVFRQVSSSASWKMRQCRLARCRFTGALREMSLYYCDLHDVDFSEAELSGRITNSSLRAVRIGLDALGQIPVSLFQSTLSAVTFAGAEVPEVPGIYRLIYAEILKGRDTEPVHPMPWLYNILETVLGRAWTDMAERHGIVTARDLLFYYNSDDTTLFTFGPTGSHTVEIIRSRAEVGGFAG